MIGKIFQMIDAEHFDRNNVESGKEYIRLKRQSLIQELTEK